MKVNSSLTNVSNDPAWKAELENLNDTIPELEATDPAHAQSCRKLLHTILEFEGLKIDQATHVLTADDPDLILAILARAGWADGNLTVEGADYAFSWSIEDEYVVIRAEQVASTN